MPKKHSNIKNLNSHESAKVSGGVDEGKEKIAEPATKPLTPEFVPKFPDTPPTPSVVKDAATAPVPSGTDTIKDTVEIGAPTSDKKDSLSPIDESKVSGGYVVDLSEKEPVKPFKPLPKPGYKPQIPVPNIITKYGGPAPFVPHGLDPHGLDIGTIKSPNKISPSKNEPTDKTNK